MKIAISGSGGIGKTTFARNFAERTGVACIHEDMDDLFDRLPAGSTDFSGFADEFFGLLEKKRQAELEAGSFITDRCPVDLFSLWMCISTMERRRETAEFHKRCIRYCSHYDLIVFPPVGVFDLKPKQVGSRAGRELNPWVQMRNQANMIGLSSMYVGPRRTLLIPVGVPPGNWGDFVLDALAQRARPAAAA